MSYFLESPSKWNGIQTQLWTHNHLVRKWTLDHLAKIRPVWLNGWVFVYELSGCEFESHCCQLRLQKLFNQLTNLIVIVDTSKWGKSPKDTTWKKVTYNTKRGRMGWFRGKQYVLIAWCRVQYGENFPNFAITAKYSK